MRQGRRKTKRGRDWPYLKKLVWPASSCLLSTVLICLVPKLQLSYQKIVKFLQYFVMSSRPPTRPIFVLKNSFCLKYESLLLFLIIIITSSSSATMMILNKWTTTIVLIHLPAQDDKITQKSVLKRVWPDLAKFRHFGKIKKAKGQFWNDLFSIWQKFEPIFSNFKWLLANFHWSKRPNIQQII